MKRKKAIIGCAAALVSLAVLVGAVALRFDLSALPEPGQFELALATRAKHFLVRRSSRAGIPAPLARSSEAIAEGKKLYGMECSMCHGMDGHALTDNGRWMYPRAADLTSPAVQQYSDQELFWIVKNGIRMTGMPAFGRVETDEHIGQIVQYVRSLDSSAPPGQEAAR